MKSNYIEKTSSLLNILEAARQAGVSSQRFRRVVQRLKIPVSRSGWTVLIDRAAVKRVREAIARGEIRRGRPPAKKKARGLGAP